MTLDELLARARRATPRNPLDPKEVLDWRGVIHALRHLLEDRSRAAEVADALLGLAASLTRLGETGEGSLAELQDHVWRYARLKGSASGESFHAAEEMVRRLRPLGSDQRRRLLADLYRVLLSAETDLLAQSID